MPRDKPLSLNASLAFEQSYEGVDGDSASSTELYAILSSLSGLLIKQGIAVYRFGESAGTGPGHRRRQSEDRRILRCLQSQGVDGRAGCYHPSSEC